MKGPESTQRSSADLARDITLLSDIAVTVAVEIGSTEIPVSDVLNMKPSSVFRLHRAAGTPADIRINGRLVAWGEITASNETASVRITEIMKPGTVESGGRQ